MPGSGAIYQERGKWIAQIAVGSRGHSRKVRRTRTTREEAELALAELAPAYRTTADRFWAKVEKSATCWLWTGATDGNGYGKLTVRNRDVSAHRFSYQLAHGPIPDGLFVLHRCDVKLCVRPKDLFLGTQADNMADYAVKRASQRVTSG